MRSFKSEARRCSAMTASCSHFAGAALRAASNAPDRDFLRDARMSPTAPMAIRPSSVPIIGTTTASARPCASTSGNDFAARRTVARLMRGDRLAGRMSRRRLMPGRGSRGHRHVCISEVRRWPFGTADALSLVAIVCVRHEKSSCVGRRDRYRASRRRFAETPRAKMRVTRAAATSGSEVESTASCARPAAMIFSEIIRFASPAVMRPALAWSIRAATTAWASRASFVRSQASDQ